MKINMMLWLLLWSLSSHAFNENSGIITGKVLDKNSGAPLSYVTVVVKQYNEIVTGSITDEKGVFTIKGLAWQSFELEVQFMGYTTQKIPIQLSSKSKSLDLGVISLEEEVVVLNNVEVVGEKSTIVQKIDRKVVNVGVDLINAGPTASDMLNNIPSVSVDPQNNSVTLRGNSNVRIFIDGKPTNLSASQVLQQIPSASIKQIELITNPSAKYNPEGMSGIINIILHKNANLGFNGSVNAGANFAITPKGNASVEMNYRVNKVNFYTNYSINNGIWRNEGFIRTESSFNEDNSNLSDFYIRNHNNNNFWKGGMDYYLNDKSTLSFFTVQSFFNNRSYFATDVSYFNGVNPDVTQIFEAYNKGSNQIYNLGYKLKFDNPMQTLDIEVNYNRNKTPEDSQFYDGNRNLLQTNQIENIGDNLIINADFVLPVGETAKWELGLESRFDGTNNEFDRNFTAFSDFEYKRNIQSAYANFGKQSGAWSYQLGVRLENYIAEALFNQVDETPGTFKDEIFTFYPSAFLTYEASEKNSFNLSYSRRVDRPSIGQVNPIRDWASPTIDQVGNPELRPQFTNSVEFNFTRKIKTGSITSGVFFRYVNDLISQVVLTSPFDQNKRLLTYDNFDNNTQYGIEVSGNLNLEKWWSLNFGVDSYFRNAKGIVENQQRELEEKTVDAILFNARMNHTFTVNKDFRIIWFTMYRGGVDDIQFNNELMWRTDLGFRYNILNGKGSIGMRFNDMFNTMRARFNSVTPDDVRGQFRWESRMLNVNFNYRFGSGDNKAMQRKQRDRNETQGGGLF
ncbi:MAG: TonB-dependent receptor domain-containing protein [Flavobacterium sp.]